MPNKTDLGDRLNRNLSRAIWLLVLAVVPVATLGRGVAHIGVFLAKVFALLLLFIWVRWMWPRFRYDQLMDLGWRRFIPVALANILVTAIWLWWKSGN